MPALLYSLRSFLAPGPGQVPNLFAASATVLSISTVYLYFSGYIFSYFYYGEGFGVTLESLDLSPQFYFMRSYTCLRTPGGICLVILLLVVINIYLRGGLRAGPVLLAMLAVFPVLFYISYHTAWTERQENFCRPSSTIQFRFKEPATKTPVRASQAEAVTGPDPFGSDRVTGQELVELGQQNELSLLLETKDRLVVFKKPNCYLLGAGSPRIPPAAHIYTVLRSDLEFTHITP
jgi:hypothetical protein